ncbi:hypothetical protein GOB57_10290 [Sinorhizobium meliloti]|nr:hypothetical protein [Sinorhizobium meliloti]
MWLAGGRIKRPDEAVHVAAGAEPETLFLADDEGLVGDGSHREYRLDSGERERLGDVPCADVVADLDSRFRIDRSGVALHERELR